MMTEPASRTGTIRVVIADDDPDIRVLLRSLLDLDTRIEVSGEASDGAEALARFTELRPDVLVLDERMPVMYGLEVAQRVLVDHPDQVVILCTAYVDATVMETATTLGVSCVLGKGDIHRLGEEILRLVS
jgi:YesN/AraC family two-component response regulator